jgi:predicted Rossmann fold nucleotide-binding protein DprA/Smf involved in DNA uptake
LDEVGLVQQSAKIKSENTCAGKLGIKSVSVVKAIGHQKCLFQAIKVECKLSTPQLNAELIQLEAAGLIRQEGGRNFGLGWHQSSFLA